MRTDRHDEANGRFCNFENVPTNLETKKALHVSFNKTQTLCFIVIVEE